MLHKLRPYFTYANAVLAIAFLLAISWVWGTIEALQQNFLLERQVTQLEHTVELDEIEVQLLEHEQRYYESDEYLELAAREHFGRAAPGEKMLILPENTVTDTLPSRDTVTPKQEPPGNLQQWTMFLFSSKE